MTEKQRKWGEKESCNKNTEDEEKNKIYGIKNKG